MNLIIAVGVEFIITMIPFITMLIKIGQWKGEIDLKIKHLEGDNKELHGYYSQILNELTKINKTLTTLGTKFEIYEKKMLGE